VQWAITVTKTTNAYKYIKYRICKQSIPPTYFGHSFDYPQGHGLFKTE